ncbi:MAG TPA: hypothetical protein VGP36_16400 [Mycobacteriales bacterium]|nr:hypothetical protein [Mycobacteriales bacterium]
MLGVLRTICTVVGAGALYGALMVALWYGVMRAGKHRARMHADRRVAARAVPVTGSAHDRSAEGRERRARSWEELPSWLWRDRPWAVAVVLLGAPSVRDRTAPFVDFPNRVIDWKTLLDESRAWPPDQRLLVQSAYEMAFDTPGEVTRAMSDPVTLRDLVRHLDDDEVDRIRVAMQIRRVRLEPEDGITTLS